MSRYHHNKTTHELEPIAGYGSRVATSVDGKTLTVHSSLLNIDGYNYGSGDIGAAINMIATIESGMEATKDYDAGECFVYNAILYVVTEDVDDGDEFVIGENCVLAPTLTDQIMDIDGKSDAAITKADTVSDQLIVDGSRFYFDSHDGQFGYNTSANRGADTFVPFRSPLQYVIQKGTTAATLTLDHDTNLLMLCTSTQQNYLSSYTVKVNDTALTFTSLGNIGNGASGWGLCAFYANGNFKRGDVITVTGIQSSYGAMVLV